jgi:hypothetical protein
VEGNTHFLKLDDYYVTENPMTNEFPFVPATTDPSRNYFNRNRDLQSIFPELSGG